MTDKDLPDKRRPGLTDIAIKDGQIQISNLGEAMVAAQAWINSGLVPNGYKKPEHVVQAWQAGGELGMGLQESLNSFAIVSGRPYMMGEAALAMVNRSGLVAGIIEHHYEGEGDDYGCVVTSRPVKSAKTVRTKFTVGDAKKAGLWGRKSINGVPSPWILYPDRQLKWRSIGFHIKDYYPEAIRRNKTAEEAMDIAMEKISVIESDGPTGKDDPLFAEPASLDAEFTETSPEIHWEPDEDEREAILAREREEAEEQ